MPKSNGHASVKEAAERSRKIAALLALGCENKEICVALHLKESSLRGYIEDLRNIHGIETTRRLVLFLAQAPGHWPKKSVLGLLDTSSYLMENNTITDTRVKRIVGV